MNLKRNEGFVGIDISIAVVVLLILVPIITGVMVNVNKTNSENDKKSQAMNIVVNTLEASKGIDITSLTEDAVITQLSSIYSGLQKVAGTSTAIIPINSIIYELNVDVVDYNEKNSSAQKNMVKTVTATVKYKAGGEEKTVEISTVVS